jgi:hypothetical protein
LVAVRLSSHPKPDRNPIQHRRQPTLGEVMHAA